MEDRLLKFLDTEQLSSARFADAIGVQRSSVSHILSGRNKPSFDFLQKTLKAFPVLNADWLILGEGNMYKGDVDPVSGSLFDQVPVGKGQDPSVITVPTSDAENGQHNFTAPGNISAGSEFESEKSPSADGLLGSDDQIHNAEPATDAGASTKDHIENETKIKSEGKNSKTISRVIVFYTDKTFDSYETGD